MKGSRIIPALRYKNGKKAVEWLCQVFGFKEHLVVPGENDSIIHAQLSYGSDMIMLGSDLDGEYGKLIKIQKDNGKLTRLPFI